MKYALVNGYKKEATKGLKGVCQGCGSELIAKCGEIKVHHWAHKSQRICDVWWENETVWHRSWKNQFPKDWQEVVQFDDNGEKHIADVKTSEDYVIEFQHSFLKPDERRSRNAFYSKLVWVVNGRRRKRDLPQFSRMLKRSSSPLHYFPQLRQVSFPEESRLLKEWLDCGVSVLFDFFTENESNKPPLWLLLPNSSEKAAFLIPYSRDEFIALHNSEGFGELANELIPGICSSILKNERSRQARATSLNFRRRRL